MVNQVFSTPIKAIDEIVHISKNNIVVKKNISRNEEFFKGHFPDYPIYPGIFIIETVHQAVHEYLSQMYLKYKLKLRKINSVRFISPVLPENQLECECCLKFDRIDNYQNLNVKAICMVGERKTTIVNLDYYLGEFK